MTEIISDRELARVLTKLGFRNDPSLRRRLFSDKLKTITTLVAADIEQYGEVTYFGHVDDYLLQIWPFKRSRDGRKYMPQHVLVKE
jgi:hypothetical protein